MECIIPVLFQGEIAFVTFTQKSSNKRAFKLKRTHSGYYQIRSNWLVTSHRHGKVHNCSHHFSKNVKITTSCSHSRTLPRITRRFPNKHLGSPAPVRSSHWMEHSSVSTWPGSHHQVGNTYSPLAMVRLVGPSTHSSSVVPSPVTRLVGSICKR